MRSILTVVTGLTMSGAAVGVARAAEAEWSATLAFVERYDDNITELSDQDLDRLDAQGGGDGFSCGSASTQTSGGRYSIETPDDLVSIPELSGTLRAVWPAGRPTDFDFQATAYEYA